LTSPRSVPRLIDAEKNNLEQFKRSREGELKYKQFKDGLKARGIDKTALLLGHELNWAKLDAEGKIVETYMEPKSTKLLNSPDDILIVPNKFPYNFDPRVSHLLVWTKVSIESDPESPQGDISMYTRQLIERYIDKTFVQWLGIPRGRILWFRNWSALQSVENISHIHVLIYDMDPVLKHQVCGSCGVPLSPRDYERYKL
jgi:hypothetical protein